MVYWVASSSGRANPPAFTATEMASAMCSSGTEIAASTASASLCIVLVQISTMSAPPRSNERASRIISASASSQAPRFWMATMREKSTERSRISAEARPPRRRRTSSFRRGSTSAVLSQLMPPISPIVFISQLPVPVDAVCPG